MSFDLGFGHCAEILRLRFKDFAQTYTYSGSCARASDYHPDAASPFDHFCGSTTPASLYIVLLPLTPCRFLTIFAAATIYHMSYSPSRILRVRCAQ